MRLPLLAAFLLLCSSFNWAQEARPAQVVSAAPAPPSYAGEAAIVEQSEIAFRYNADGTGTEDVHVVAKVQNDAGARQMSVITAAYASDTQKAQVESLSVQHADGTTTVTPSSDAMDLPAQVTQEAPLYSDVKVLQIPVRGLRAGDTLEYRIQITQTKPQAPNEFWNGISFLQGVVARSESLTLDVPAGQYVQVWSPKYSPSKTELNGRVIYRWTSSQLQPTSSDKAKDANATTPASTNPDVAWTTFHNWQQVGDWYRSLAAPGALPTDALKAQARQITQEAKTPEDQVKAIYAFVSSRIRYIGVDFGIGWYQPHPAPTVLANQYGDCKDKDTLLEALLKAKGFTTAPALVGVGIDMIPELPTPQLFNHVITTVELPSGEIWLDSTPEVAPYRYLLPTIRDKQVLVIPASGEAKLEQTPAEAPYPFVDRFTARGALKTDGEVDAHVDIDDRSDAEIVLRAVARNLAPAQWDQGTQYLAQLLGFSGTTSNSSFGRADDYSAPISVSYDYVKKPLGDWSNLRIVPLFPVVELPAVPDKQPANELDLGSPRTEIAETEIHLPVGYGAELPDAVHVKTPFVTFDETFDLENGELTIRRKIVVLESKMPASSWQDYKKFAADSSFENLAYIQLTPPSTENLGAHAPQLTAPSAANLGAHAPQVTAPQENADAAKLLEQAGQQAQEKNFEAARAKLDQAKALQPDQPYLWSTYGWIEMMQGQMDAAEKDLYTELELHPAETRVALMEASVLHTLHRNTEACGVLNAAFSRDHSNTHVALMLAQFEAENNVADAIATLQTALAASPKDESLMEAMASFLLLDDRSGDAKPYALEALSQAQTAGALNDASYTLAETGNDLPLAEQKSRSALDLLDADTSQASIGSANQHSFRQAMLLVASWDTLGYILFRENKLEEAQDYLEAAWRNWPNVTTGLHYGEALEELGKYEEALSVYHLSDGGPGVQSPAKSADRLQLESLARRIVAQGLRSSTGDPRIDLQNQRTFHIGVAHAYKSFASGTFRLQLRADGVHDVLLVSGDDALNSAADAIRHIKLPHLVPEHSKGQMLRDAVLTCSAGERSCELVLIPLGGIGVEQTQKSGAGK